jgi:hypothetical protein
MASRQSRLDGVNSAPDLLLWQFSCTERQTQVSDWEGHDLTAKDLLKLRHYSFGTEKVRDRAFGHVGRQARNLLKDLEDPFDRRCLIDIREREQNDVVRVQAALESDPPVGKVSENPVLPCCVEQSASTSMAQMNSMGDSESPWRTWRCVMEAVVHLLGAG